MAETLLRTRCTAGWLTITDTAVRIERAGVGGQMTVIPRTMLVAASLQMTAPPLFGRGGAATLTFAAQGTAAVVVRMVRLSDARRIMELLGYA